MSQIPSLLIPKKSRKKKKENIEKIEPKREKKIPAILKPIK